MPIDSEAHDIAVMEVVRLERRIAQLEAVIRGLVHYGYPEHAHVRRRELERGLGTETPGGRAWLAAFSAIGKPVKIRAARSESPVDGAQRKSLAEMVLDDANKPVR